ncbi:MAG: carbon-nitrogen hydrolase family protein [Chitinophagaceae bacterium]|nr:carbon-nitrogen hydrolase family protein [Chitinophagaceae bacterium]
MGRNDNNSRRNFLKNSSIGLGAGLIQLSPASSIARIDAAHGDLPFEINVATIDIKDGFKDENAEQRLNRVLRSMKNVSGLKPDIVCLPEGFTSFRISKPGTLNSMAQHRAQNDSLTSKISAFARNNKCVVTCPVITRKENRFFSSTMVFGDNGYIAGIYDKMHPSKKEMIADADGNRVTPGSLSQPLIKTRFGQIGLLMGDDVYNAESWRDAAHRGAKIIIYGSTFAGGRMLNYHAVANHCYIIASTSGEGRIVDISGNDIDKTSEFIRYSWSKLNTERTNILTFPNRLPELFRKYGNRLQLKAWGSTDMLTIESNDATLRVKDVLKEFGLQTYAELIATETRVQNEYRGK